ncbi:glutathione S-transferase family protein [Paraburkholderia sp. RL17-347-BIC-D]|uniref:glutathione S-transferase family protein n=1 Tax=Paraburkholderia sp. RL17-347-BIC-D TaxID=3031632 RepID=UPI0038B76DD9
MITLYAADSPNVLKIYLALEEMGLEYRAIPVDVMAGQNFSPEFMRLNPNAKVPVVVDEDGPTGSPLTVFESGAVLIYLAEKTGKLIPSEASRRYQVLEWLMVQMSGLGPLFGQFIHFHLFAPDGNDYALSRYSTLAHRVIGALETRLSEAEWLGGCDYSVADIATFPWARPLSRIFGPGVEAEYPRLMEWLARIAARPATGRALAAVEEIGRLTTAPGEASPEALDLVFGRGTHAYARA